MNATKYPIGTIATFKSCHGPSARDGQECEVTEHGNGSDESGISHGIKFTSDGRTFGGAVYPRELTVVRLGDETAEK